MISASGHVEQRRHLGARWNGLVELEPRGRESDAEVARAVRLLAALDDLAAVEERGGDDGLRRVGGLGLQISHVHDSPP